MRQLNLKNLDKYLAEEYGEGAFSQVDAKTLPARGLVQADYGERLDCTITSITCFVWLKSGFTLPAQDIYDYAEKVGKWFFYNGEKWGTPFGVIKCILDTTLKHFGYSPSKKQIFFKSRIGFSFDTIKQQIDGGNPVILSTKNDGRNYYKNHTVLVMGYRVMKRGDTTVPILVVLDNWTKLVSYIDFNKLHTFSTINFQSVLLTFRKIYDIIFIEG